MRKPRLLDHRALPTVTSLTTRRTQSSWKVEDKLTEKLEVMRNEMRRADRGLSNRVLAAGTSTHTVRRRVKRWLMGCRQGQGNKQRVGAPLQTAIGQNCYHS